MKATERGDAWLFRRVYVTRRGNIIAWRITPRVVIPLLTPHVCYTHTRSRATTFCHASVTELCTARKIFAPRQPTIMDFSRPSSNAITFSASHQSVTVTSVKISEELSPARSVKARKSLRASRRPIYRFSTRIRSTLYHVCEFLA